MNNTTRIQNISLLVTMSLGVALAMWLILPRMSHAQTDVMLGADGDIQVTAGDTDVQITSDESVAATADDVDVMVGSPTKGSQGSGSADAKRAEIEVRSGNPGVGMQERDQDRVRVEQSDDAMVVDAGSVSVRGNAVSLQAVEVRGWDATQKQAFMATVKSHAEVRSDQELENFARGVMIQDDNVEDVSVDDAKVVVKYRMKARFLGIFPTTLGTSVEVATDEATSEDRVKVSFPWYRFLFALDDGASSDELEDELAPQVAVTLGDTADVNVTTRATVLNTVANTLRVRAGGVQVDVAK